MAGYYDKDELKEKLDVEQIFDLLELWGGEPEYVNTPERFPAKYITIKILDFSLAILDVQSRVLIFLIYVLR